MPIASLIISIILIFILFLMIFYYSGVIYGFILGAPYVPTKNKMVDKMVEAADIKKGEIAFDLGCGDGRLLFAAEEKGAKCIGVEISPQVWALATFKKLIKRKRTKFRIGNMFKVKDIKKADIIFIYTFTWNMRKFYKKVFPKLKKGTKIVSNSFPLEKLKPTKFVSREETGANQIFMYVK